MPGIIYQSFALWSMACDARDRAHSSEQELPNAYARDATVAIILAAASTEAFINEFTATISLYKKSKNCRADVTPQLDGCEAVLTEVESERGSAPLKFLWASKLLSNAPFEKGRQPFQDYATLNELRNELMHFKLRETLNFVGDSESQSEDGRKPKLHIKPSKTIQTLRDRGFAKKDDASGLNLIQTSKVACWACDTALNIICAILDMIPDPEVTPENDPSWSFKVAFREHSKSRELREQLLADGTPPGKLGSLIYLED